jgi:hypothetical protein
VAVVHHVDVERLRAQPLRERGGQASLILGHEQPHRFKRSRSQLKAS